MVRGLLQVISHIQRVKWVPNPPQVPTDQEDPTLNQGRPTPVLAPVAPNIFSHQLTQSRRPSFPYPLPLCTSSPGNLLYSCLCLLIAAKVRPSPLSGSR
ncbi:hypothetical protein FKM82_000943 [Ascaphus truei]